MGKLVIFTIRALILLDSNDNASTIFHIDETSGDFLNTFITQHRDERPNKWPIFHIAGPGTHLELGQTDIVR